MAIKRATMQDIADACGLSRNTVSKVFNGRGTVPEATRQMVLQKAQEIGYGQIPKEAPTMTEQPRKSVALLTCNMPRDFHFGTIFLPAFAERLSRSGYALVMYEITPEEQQRNALPSHMVPEQTAGIVCIELFNRVYMDMVCNLGIPVIFIDAYAGATLSVANCDTIYMDNIASIIALTRHVVEKGAKSIGFIGKPDHCESFRERWEGFKTAMQQSGIALDPSQCILEGNHDNHLDMNWIIARLDSMPRLPDAFVCANDIYAINLIGALKQKGLSVPTDVMVTGFDGTSQSTVVDPPLTTARIPSAEIGQTAADILLNRLDNPSRPFKTVYMKTTPVYRQSTDASREL